MLQIRRILQLLDNGASQRDVNREVGISRNTVQGYHSKFLNTGKTFQELLGLSDHELHQILFEERTSDTRDTRYQILAPRLARYHKELGRTGVTRLLLWQEYRREVDDPYSYQQFCFHLSNHLRISSAVMHFEHKPGDKGEIDFAGEPMSYVDRETGELIKCPVLVAVLPFSGYAFVEPLVNAQLEHLVPALNACAEYFEGLPMHLVSDNMAQVVKSANRYEPSFTELITQWSVHYNVTVIATRVAKPRDKASVEKAVDLAYKRIYGPLRDRVFHSLEQLNEAVKERLKEHNHMLFQKKDYSRYDLYLQEKTSLRPLPQKAFELKYSTSAKVQKNYHVTLGQDWHHYSVPYRYIGKKIRIVYDTTVVEVFDGLNRIALHKRDYRKHGYSTLEIHMPEKHLKFKESLGWDEDYFLSKAEQVGENFRKVIEYILKSRHFTQQTYLACLGLLRLKDKYGKDRLEAACQRALHGSSITYRSIDAILVNGADRQIPLLPETPSVPEHDNIRGPQNYY